MLVIIIKAILTAVATIVGLSVVSGCACVPLFAF